MADQACGKQYAKKRKIFSDHIICANCSLFLKKSPYEETHNHALTSFMLFSEEL